MRLGFIADAHGNLLSYRACVKRLWAEGVDELYFLGDAVGYWPQGIEVLQDLAEDKIPCIMGNHEAMVLGMLAEDMGKEKIYKLEPIRNAMSAMMRRGLVRDWPLRREFERDSIRMLLVHGRPADPLQGYCYEEDDLCIEEYGGVDLIVMGHTHRPFTRWQENTAIINAGSCGLPRDRDDMVSCAVYDTRTKSADVLRVPIN
ncbi:hypothetical protein GF348_06750, partial [candidate division KSB3 bacterium]|nr:hypothetical protein [candidate division KSB3 bacterium]